MTATLEFESTLTDRYQATVPETSRRDLRLGKSDKIRYAIRPGGEVVLTRVAAAQADDPLLLGFLTLDMASHPERLQAVDAVFFEQHQLLTGSLAVDLNAALSAGGE